MSRETTWVAVMLVLVLVLMALLSPAQAKGQLPTLEEMERPAVECHVPLVCPAIRQMQRLVTTITWQLEAIPME